MEQMVDWQQQSGQGGLRLEFTCRDYISTCCVGTGREETNSAASVWPCSAGATWVGDRGEPPLISSQQTEQKNPKQGR